MGGSGPDWEADFEREWNRIFKPDAPLPKLSSQRPTSYPFRLEAVVRAAMADLRRDLGGTWLPNSIYGTRLHAALRRRLGQVTPAAGWRIEVEQPLRLLGLLPPALLHLSVQQYLDGPGRHLDWLRPQLSRQFHSLVGEIRPDLLIWGPDGVVTVWDLTSREQQEHLAKTILYANLLTRENQLARIGETYWLKFR